MKKLFLLTAIAGAFIIYSCGSEDSTNSPDKTSTTTATSPSSTEENPSYDPERGKGKFTHVDVPEKLDVKMAVSGEKIFGVKCSGCHKLTDEKLVGPGWKGVTAKHKPEWILNFITNTDEMIDKDPKVQAQLELCLVRMPNQNLSDEDARALYEFMRKNDGIK